MLRIERIESEKKRFLALLLLADPDEPMVDKYLEAGDMYVLYDGDDAVCEAVVTRRPDGACELKNLATYEHKQNKGYASHLVKYLFCEYAARYADMYVGTAAVGTGFYERLGFSYAYTEKGFFTCNYPEPIYDRGVLCEDMIYLKKPLRDEV